jgi:L-ascorbate metabolism protein UlaG (beta-lactamase superfamily)
MLDMKGNRMTYFGHSTFLLTTPSGQVALIDPWVMTNPICPEKTEESAPAGCDFSFARARGSPRRLTALAKQHKPQIVAIFGTC